VKIKGTEFVVSAKDAIVNKTIALKPDLLVLSTGISANPDNKVLSQFLKVPLESDGFFLEAHVKLRPVDFATDGVFVCGLAHYPKISARPLPRRALPQAGLRPCFPKQHWSPKVKYRISRGNVQRMRDVCFGLRLQRNRTRSGQGHCRDQRNALQGLRCLCRLVPGQCHRSERL